jgi:predicted dienelactone hydrolase
MTYNPFVRGPYPVAVCTMELRDIARSRRFPVETWFPAADRFLGQDLNPSSQDRFHLLPDMPEISQQAVRDAAAAVGRFPLVVYSHGKAGHRRDSSNLCTHLASHGYVVAAIDHPGDTAGEFQLELTGPPGAPPLLDTMEHLTADRPADVSFVITGLLRGISGGLRELIQADRIGVMGVSFGGWTTLAVNFLDDRVIASFPIVPAWGRGLDEILQKSLDLGARQREVPTTLLVAERDALVMIDEMYRLYAQLKGHKRMVVLKNAGHLHFCDHAREIHEMIRTLCASGMAGRLDPSGTMDLKAVAENMRPFSELCPEKDGAMVVRGLGLAHFDARLKGSGEAGTFLNADLKATFARHGIAVEVL